jgi:sulfatase maturation enzyme AslB (radical SAM superfamily)
MTNLFVEGDSSKSISNKLFNQYQVECVAFIEEIENSQSSFLYKKLIPLYQPVYHDQQRFVFFNFTPVQQTTLDHIVETLHYIDISPYFVLVVTNQESTADYFKLLSDPISVIQSSDQFDQSYIQKNIAGIKPLFNTDKKMCAHAWAGLHVNPDGTTRLCCEYNDLVKDPQGTPYDIKTTDILTILDSEYIKKVRQQFRQGITPTECNNCLKIESSGGTSKRSLTPFKLENIYGNINWESDAIDSLGWIGGHLGNLCNLKCRICNETYSSSIAAEKIKFSSHKDKKQDPVYKFFANSWTDYGSKFYSNLKQIVPPIKNFEFLGGEPLLASENIKFMQHLIDSGLSKDCIFEFVTNGTQYPEIFNHADKFKRLTITLSIDNLGKRFELERSGAAWDVIESNLEKFINRKNSCTSMEVGVSITVNVQNVYYLPELIVWLTSKGISHYYYNFLSAPSWLGLDSLTSDAKIIILDKLLSADLPQQDQTKLATVIQRVQKSVTSDGQKFCSEMKKLDSIRSQTFNLTHKEIAQAMGYML